MITVKKRKPIFVLAIPSFEDIFNSFYAGEIIKGVCKTASRLKIDVLIHITDRFDHKSWLDSSLLDRKYIDGIIFADIDNDTYIVKRAIGRSIPTMVLNNMLKEPINCVTIDNRQAAVEVVQYLCKLGHRKIATIAGDLTTQAGELRLAGFKEALEKAGIDIPKSYIVPGNFMRSAARVAAQKLLSLADRPTAVFVASDVMALEVLDVARGKNIRVPEDLSVVGFDDNPINMNSDLPLTTVAQPIVEMGRLGTELLDQISRGSVPLPVKETLPTKMVIRKSTAECPR